jgi:hypothetical protein
MNRSLGRVSQVAILMPLNAASCTKMQSRYPQRRKGNRRGTTGAVHQAQGHPLRHSASVFRGGRRAVNKRRMVGHMRCAGPTARTALHPRCRVGARRVAGRKVRRWCLLPQLAVGGCLPHAACQVAVAQWSALATPPRPKASLLSASWRRHPGMAPTSAGKPSKAGQQQPPDAHRRRV